MVLFFSIALSACEIIPFDSKYSELRNQFDYLVENQINTKEALAQFINEATMFTSLSSVTIKVLVYDQEGELIETKYGAGVVFLEDGAHVHILTAYQLIDVPENHNILIRVYDFLDREHSAFLREKSEEKQLASIRFIKPLVRPLPVVNIASNPPLPGESLLLIGHQNRIINAMNMGFLVNYIEEDDFRFIETSIPSDIYGQGGVLFNIAHEMIGLQIDIDENQHAFAIGLNAIQSFIENYKG
jgi:hypothetical protein